MFWSFWALLLIGHGALSRWVEVTPRRPLTATVSDVLLLAIGVLTVSQLQELPAPDILRLGLFFVAFGCSGRRLTNAVLSRSA